MEVDNKTDFWQEYHEKSARAITWWNELFRTPFLEFKHRLSAIAARYYVSSPYDCIIQHLDYHYLTAIGELSNTWIFPMDEDDWPHPELPNILRKVNTKNFDYILWDVHRICVLGRQCVKADVDYYDRNIVISNSYAIHPGERHAHMAYHGRIDHILRNEDTRTKYLKHPLGVKVDNPSSLSLLVRCENKEMLAKITQQFIEGLDNIKVPETFKDGYDALKAEMRAL
jgi:hypothetical protein